jgi:hypothetical protein
MNTIIMALIILLPIFILLCYKKSSLRPPRPLSRGSIPDGAPSKADESNAYHEAAHAVAAVALGIGFDHVSVVDDRNTLGRIVLDQGWPHLRPGFDPSAPLDRRVAEDWVLLALVGEFASAHHIGLDPDWGSHGASSDFEVAAAVAARLFTHPGKSAAFLDEMSSRAHIFVVEPLRWRQISAVAIQLARLQMLDRRQVGQIMDDVATLGETAKTG